MSPRQNLNSALDVPRKVDYDAPLTLRQLQEAVSAGSRALTSAGPSSRPRLAP